MFIRFDRIQERDRQTDRQIPDDGIGSTVIVVWIALRVLGS